MPACIIDRAELYRRMNDEGGRGSEHPTSNGEKGSRFAAVTSDEVGSQRSEARGRRSGGNKCGAALQLAALPARCWDCIGRAIKNSFRLPRNANPQHLFSTHSSLVTRHSLPIQSISICVHRLFNLRMKTCLVSQGSGW